MFFSIIIPLYNRPEEINELLDSLTHQTYKDFEVLVIEDGSKDKADKIIEDYKDKLHVSYYYKENSGQGFTRNYGFKLAKGDFFIILDSDCIIPENYLANVKIGIEANQLDAFGGPDKDHPAFTPIQKAISYSMTSPFTTGGIRGRKKHIGTFHPRSFNMGISRKVYEKIKGFIWTRLGEDLEFSIRIIKSGFKTGLIENAFVYHKRRTNFIQFFKQLHFFGKARIHVYTEHPDTIKLAHCLPSLFVLSIFFTIIMAFLNYQLCLLMLIPLVIFAFLILFDSTSKNNSLSIGFLSIIAAYIQFIGYGLGFLQAFTNRIVLKRKESIGFVDGSLK